MSRYFKILTLTSSVALAVLVVPPVWAAQQIVLVNDQAQIVTLAEQPSTVIVGNPAIADVTTEGRMLFFHPRGFGVTNVIALDPDGKKLGDYVVSIVTDDNYTVSMYSPAGRKSFNCRKDCETTMRIGDSTTYFSAYNSQADDKNTIARGQAVGADNSTTNPQTTTNMVIAPR